MCRARLLLFPVIGLLLSPSVVSADYALGLVAFERGDVQTAHREFSALAAEGHVEAQYSLAMLYLKMNPPEYTRAIPWLEKSARSGLPESQYMLGMLSLYGVGTAKDTRQGLRWLQLASSQGNESAEALLQELEEARLREAESERRKARQARNLRAELDKAKASEQVLQKRLVESKAREKRLASERETLRKARASNSDEREKMRREQARLESELEALRARLAEAERSRVEFEAAGQVAAVEDPVPAQDLVENAPGEAIIAGRVVEVLAGGVMLTGVSRRTGGRSEPFPEGFVVFLNLATTEGLAEGQDVSFPAEPAAPYRYKLESGAFGRIRAYRATGNRLGS